MILIKIGGGEQVNIDYICEDIATLVSGGEKVIIVHGASALRDTIAKKLGTPKKIITSPSGVESVYTDEQAIDVFLMTYAGLRNKRIVALLQRHGVDAVGLSGIDGRLWEAKRKNIVYSVENGKTKMIRDNFTGKVEKINVALINLLIENNYIPVLCPPAISYDNQIVNTDNDTATAVMVKALGIKQMIILFEAAGMLKNFHDPKSLIEQIKKEELTNFMEFAVGRMKKKVLGAQRAFENGVEKIYWGDGRIKHPILNVMKGKGTIIC